jgi:hypothetical protein
MERMTRLLYGTAAILLLLGLALRIAPARVGAHQEWTAPRPQSGPDITKTPREAAGKGDAIAAGNIFSVSRSAPRVRYTPPDLVAGSETVRARPRRAAAGLKLFGTVSATAALIDANPAVPGAEIYQIGDVVGGKRIRAVTESTVVLEGSTGRTVLRLQRTQPPTR